jgi:hypothetical protein
MTMMASVGQDVEPSPTEPRLDDYYVLCEVCGEHLEHKLYYAQEHIKQTGHKQYCLKPNRNKD